MSYPFRARCYRRDTRGRLNETEAEYDNLLDMQLRCGDILWYKREGIKLRLAPKTFLDCDFTVVASDGTLELHEVKGGFIEDDAAVKLKTAAEMFPFRFILARKIKGQWELKEVGA
jgi:hypothetical protein